MPQKSFKTGDRVYYKARYGSNILSGFGVFLRESSFTELGYQIMPDNGDLPVLVEPYTGPDEVLEHEHVYNSPLYQALE